MLAAKGWAGLEHKGRSLALWACGSLFKFHIHSIYSSLRPRDLYRRDIPTVS